MQNVGSFDRLLRFVAGALLLASAFVQPMAGWVAQWGNWKYALTAVGCVMIATALFRFCPAYSLLGIRTCGVRGR